MSIAFVRTHVRSAEGCKRGDLELSDGELPVPGKT